MKRLAMLFALLLFAISANAQVAQTVANNSPSKAITPKAAGDTLLVECDYQANSASGAITDTAGTAFSPVGSPMAAVGFAQFVSISAPLSTAAADTVTCPKGTGFGEIYIVELTGAMAVDGVGEASGSASPASVTLPTASGDIVVAFCITGTCTNAAGWTSLSHFDDNQASSFVATAASTSASFATSGAWTLTAVALKPATPAPFQIAAPNCCTLTFALSNLGQLPVCGPNDGTCSVAIQICDTATPPNCLSSNAGTVSMIKSVTLPTPQTQATVVLTVAPPH